MNTYEELYKKIPVPQFDAESDPLYKQLHTMIRAKYKWMGHSGQSVLPVPLEDILANYSTQYGLSFVGIDRVFDPFYDTKPKVDALGHGTGCYHPLTWMQVKQYLYLKRYVWIVDDKEWLRDIGKLVYEHSKEK